MYETFVGGWPYRSQTPQTPQGPQGPQGPYPPVQWVMVPVPYSPSLQYEYYQPTLQYPQYPYPQLTPAPFSYPTPLPPYSPVPQTAPGSSPPTPPVETAIPSGLQQRQSTQQLPPAPPVEPSVEPASSTELAEAVLSGSLASHQPSAPTPKQVEKLLEASIEPQVDVVQTGDEMTVFVDVPGCDKKEIELEGSGNTLTIVAERKASKIDGQFVAHERPLRVERTIELPARANLEAAKASYRNGTLSIVLPKTDEEKRGRIGIQ